MILFQKYKRMIRDAGFEDLLKTNMYRYDREILKYIKPKVQEQPGMTYEEVKKLQEELYSKEKIEERLNKLKKLWEDTHDIISDHKILYSLERLIIYGDNWLKYRDVDCYYNIYHYNSSAALLGVHNGDIYIFNWNDYSVMLNIKNDMISYFSEMYEEEELRSYNPKYINPNEPIDMSLVYNKGYLKEKAKADYQKALAKYQADLIKAEIHNREEDRKYRESIGKTIKRDYVYIYYYASEEDKAEEKISNIRFANGISLFKYLIKRLPNIDKFDDINPKYYKGLKNTCIKGIKTIGIKEYGYIDILNEMHIKSSKPIENGFEICFDDKTKIIFKKYKGRNIDEIVTEYKSLEYELETGSYKAYFDKEYYVDFNYYLEILRSYGEEVIYIYSNCKENEMRVLNLFNSYVENKIKKQNEVQEYNVFEI